MSRFPEIFICDGELWIQNHKIWEFMEAYHNPGTVPSYHPSATFEFKNVKYEYVLLFSNPTRKGSLDTRTPCRRIVFLDDQEGVMFRLIHGDSFIPEPRISDAIDPNHAIS